MAGRPMLLFTTLVYLVHIATSDICSSNAPAGSVDGCSIPLHLPFPHKADFNTACNMHDVCYDCAALFGKARTDCDNAFRRNMNITCQHHHKRFLFNNADECQSTALVYYEAVHLAAASHFSSVSKSYCSESWVRQCLGHL